MLAILPQITVFYFSFMKKSDQELYQPMLTDLLKGVAEEKRKVIMAVMRRLRAKGLTKQGRARKQRIVDKLFCKRRHLLALSHVIDFVLPQFKKFVLAFESKEPMIHKLHDSMVDIFRNFLSLFVKMEQVKFTVNLDQEDHLLSLKQVVRGSKTEEILDQMQKSDKNNFVTNLRTAYRKTGQYMQKKLPINNGILKSLSSLDPIIRTHSFAVAAMKSLKDFFPTVQVDTDQYEADVREYHLAKDVPSSENMRLDQWWSKLFPKFPALAEVVKACLCIFTGPKVEQSFSMMNHIITKKTNRLGTDTYQAYLSIKYHLLARKLTAVKMFHRDDKVYGPVDKSLVFHIQSARQQITIQSKTNKTEAMAKQSVSEKRTAIDSLEGAPAPKRQK